MAYWSSLVVVLLVAVTSSTCQEANFTHRAYLDAAENYFLQWRYDAETITFRVEVATLGYVGFGISPNGDMTGADIVTGFVTDQGDTFFYDRYATTRATPPIDASQDWTLEASGENDTHTFLQFSRKLVLCDDTDRTIKAETSRVIWSYHESDPPRDTELMYHGETRGARSLMLLSVAENRNLPEDVQSIEFLNDAYAVPSNTDTTYLCRGFRVPNLGGKHHIVSIEPVIQAGNEGVVHHIVLYMCSAEPDPDLYHGVQHLCRTRNMPDDWNTCRTTLIAWAVGGETFYYPENVGQSIGGPGDPAFVLMETHYDNPQQKSGIVDSSGLRFWYTSDLREHDMGRMELGVEVTRTHFIPPRSSSFVTVGICYPDCLEKRMEEESVEKIHVFGVMLHSHLAGRKMRIRHVRNGVELPWLAKDDNYDFNYQQTSRLEREVEVLPGDYFIMECTYETTDRNSVTYGGLSTRDEMCLAWISFYPKMKLSVCKSSPHYAWFLLALGATDFTYSFTKGALVPSAPPHLAGYTLWELLGFLSWNEAFRQKFQDVERTANRTALCLNENFSPQTFSQQVQAIQDAPPLINQPRVEPDVCNVLPTTTSTTTTATASRGIAASANSPMSDPSQTNTPITSYFSRIPQRTFLYTKALESASSQNNAPGTPSHTNVPNSASFRSSVSGTPANTDVPDSTPSRSNVSSIPFYSNAPMSSYFYSTVQRNGSSTINATEDTPSLTSVKERIASHGVANSLSLAAAIVLMTVFTAIVS